MRDFLKEKHADGPTDLGTELMGRIARVMPVPLVAHALVEGVRSVVALEAVLRRRIARAEAQGIVLHIPRGDIPYTIEVGLRALMERHHVTRAGDRLTVSPQGDAFLAFYAASIQHLVGERSVDLHMQDAKILSTAT